MRNRYIIAEIAKRTQLFLRKSQYSDEVEKEMTLALIAKHSRNLRVGTAVSYGRDAHYLLTCTSLGFVEFQPSVKGCQSRRERDPTDSDYVHSIQIKATGRKNGLGIAVHYYQFSAGELPSVISCHFKFNCAMQCLREAQYKWQQPLAKGAAFSLRLKL